jgi:hypothetical protein
MIRIDALFGPPRRQTAVTFEEVMAMDGLEFDICRTALAAAGLPEG